ncbi:hypothetical protein Ocin01_09791 [Orchesella cincta]|uniref:Uncharacterized protein n=1 Tax=Orchesella cincta TaxID=48709 RepID=A0A1D2MV81_ORCCI|nr:hypothetical protein Ocin01_09791 [Orchesella cincta]
MTRVRVHPSMETNLIYFRPEKRFVNDDLLKDTYNYKIKDAFTKAENVITVPIYLTVFQFSKPNVCKKRRRPPSMQEKMCFYLIGSKQEPPMIDHSATVDRIEFHGHIGFEEPVFEIIKNLKELRKIAFFLDPKKQGNFIQLSRINNSNNSNSTNNKKIKYDSSYCKNVTSLKLVLERSDGCSEEQSLSMAKKETLRVMIIRLLRRTTDLCPNIKRLTVEVPNWKGIRTVVDEILEKIAYLKPTKMSFDSNNYISVRKITDNFSEDDESTSVSANSDTAVPSEDDQSSCNEDVTITDEGCSDDQVDSENSDEPAPRLEDMSKLLGSILGIPTSSGPPSPPLSSSSTDIPLQDSSGSTAPQQTQTDCELTSTLTSNTNTRTTASSSFQRSSLSSSSEIISYAAAAASTKSFSSAVRKNGNGNNSLQQHKYINNNEGSRKTLRDGEGSTHDEQSSNSNLYKKPSIPNVADLGKPVVVSAATQVL